MHGGKWERESRTIPQHIGCRQREGALRRKLGSKSWQFLAVSGDRIADGLEAQTGQGDLTTGSAVRTVLGDDETRELLSAAGVVDGHDVRMIQLGDGAGFANAKSGGGNAQAQLRARGERHHATKGLRTRPVGCSHLFGLICPRFDSDALVSPLFPDPTPCPLVSCRSAIPL